MKITSVLSILLLGIRMAFAEDDLDLVKITPVENLEDVPSVSTVVSWIVPLGLDQLSQFNTTDNTTEYVWFLPDDEALAKEDNAFTCLLDDAGYDWDGIQQVLEALVVEFRDNQFSDDIEFADLVGSSKSCFQDTEITPQEGETSFTLDGGFVVKQDICLETNSNTSLAYISENLTIGEEVLFRETYFNRTNVYQLDENVYVVPISQLFLPVQTMENILSNGRCNEDLPPPEESSEDIGGFGVPEASSDEGI